jgi:hypothetical protein
MTCFYGAVLLAYANLTQIARTPCHIHQREDGGYKTDQQGQDHNQIRR